MSDNLSSLQDNEEFSFKGIGSEGSGDKDSSLAISISIVEKEDEAKADSVFLFILPGMTLKKENLISFLDSESRLFSRVAVLTSGLPEGEEIISYSQRLIDEIEKMGLRRVTVVASEDGANIAQALCLLDPKLIRKAALINPRSKVHPTLSEQIVDKIESFLPVGLPFRSLTSGFNSRPFLHRIRCPILVLISRGASLFSQSESEYIANKIPNCYFNKLGTSDYFNEDRGFPDEVLKLLLEFQGTSPKRPQKNR